MARLRKIEQAYQIAGQLLLAVVEETLDAKTAIYRWPRISDASLQAAYQALLHFEVDQEAGGYHHEIPYYADVQLKWLETLGMRLSQGASLDTSTLIGYGSNHRIRFYDRPNLVIEFLKESYQEMLSRFSTKQQPRSIEDPCPP